MAFYKSLLYHALAIKGIQKSLRKLMMDVLSKGILACTCKDVRLREKRQLFQSDQHYCEFSVQRSGFGSRSLPSLDFCDIILVTLELSPRETRTEYRRAFSPLCFRDMQGHTCGLWICVAMIQNSHAP